MSAKQRDRAYRLAQQKKHNENHKPGQPKEGRRKDAYKQNKRNAERVALKQGDWGWL